MSQFNTSFEEPGVEEQKTSALAATSLICSLIFFCPVTTLIGPVLGFISLATIGNSGKKGRGLAVAGILIGIVLTTGWAIGGYYLVGFVGDAMRFVQNGPTETFTAGFQGDTAAFKAQFYGAGATASDEEVMEFIDELRDRYGEFTVCTLNDQGGQTQPAFGQPVITMPYRARFGSTSVNADIELVFADEQTGQVIMKLGSITILDADRGDLSYPAAP